MKPYTETDSRKDSNMGTTPPGIPIINCPTCGREHPPHTGHWERISEARKKKAAS